MVKIIADSTCDLSEELITKLDIGILPLHILLGKEEYEDGKNLTPEQIYNWSDENKQTPKTSAPSLDTAIGLFEPYVKEGRELVCFSISEKMSSCANVMRLAATELEAEEQIHVVNSENLSTGIGLLVVEAAIMAENGVGAVEIVKRVTELIPKVRASFVVDTLVYLHRGGRCNGLSAMLGSAIRLHPRIVVKDGAMSSDRKYRGKMKNVLLAYAKDLEERMLHSRKERVFITHSGCDQENVDTVYEYVKGLHHFQEIYVTRAGGVISSHCGPGTLGVLFIDEG